MKLGEGVEAAIHCATALGALPDRATMPASALAEAYGLSPSYLLKTLKTLSAHGILTSVPGPAGGYRLARPANEVSLLDIVIAVEGPEPAFRCQNIRRNGPCSGLGDDAFPAPCGIHKAMLAAERAYRRALGAVTLSELIEDHLVTSDPRVIDAHDQFAGERLRGLG